VKTEWFLHVNWGLLVYVFSMCVLVFFFFSGTGITYLDSGGIDFCVFLQVFSVGCCEFVH